MVEALPACAGDQFILCSATCVVRRFLVPLHQAASVAPDLTAPRRMAIHPHRARWAAWTLPAAASPRRSAAPRPTGATRRLGGLTARRRRGDPPHLRRRRGAGRAAGAHRRGDGRPRARPTARRALRGTAAERGAGGSAEAVRDGHLASHARRAFQGPGERIAEASLILQFWPLRID